MSLNTCIKDATGSFKFSCAVNEDGSSTIFQDVYSDALCTGTPESFNGTLFPVCRSEPVVDVAGASDNFEVFCTNHTAPWTEYGSEYILTQ